MKTITWIMVLVLSVGLGYAAGRTRSIEMKPADIVAVTFQDCGDDAYLELRFDGTSVKGRWVTVDDMGGRLLFALKAAP